MLVMKILTKIGLTLIILLAQTLIIKAQDNRSSKILVSQLLEEIIYNQGISETMQKFNEIKNDTANYFFDEAEIDDLGYTLLAESKINEAVAIFEIGVRQFPESGNSYSSLADAFLFAGEKTKAEENYKIALEKGAWGQARINHRLENLETIYDEVQSSKKNIITGNKSTGLNGEYLGQTLPDDKPVLFAPGIVSMIGWSFGCTFSSDGKEFYFSRGNKKKIILVSRLENNAWTKPSQVDFTSGNFASEPCLTADNKIMYFGFGEGISFVERTSDGWTEPRFAGEGMHVSSTKDGQIYITDLSEISKGIMTIAKVTIKDNCFYKVERLSDGIEKARTALQRLAHPCIAPDGSYILFDNGRGMLHLSFRDNSGRWGDAINLTEHGINPNASGAFITPDGKYIFFSIFNDLYWMSTNFIKKLRG